MDNNLNPGTGPHCQLTRHGAYLQQAHGQVHIACAERSRWPNSMEGAALALFAWPDSSNETNHFEMAIPHFASLILTYEWNGELVGLKDFPRDERPPVAPIFFSFRIMVGLGMLMLLAGMTGL